MSLRAKRCLVRLACHSPVLVLSLMGALLGELAGDPSTAGFFALLLTGYAVTLRVNPVPPVVEKRIITEAECPACGQVIDLVNAWSCGCGFLTWEPRHAFSPCPNCKKVFRWLVCPTCEASIPI